MTDQDTGELVRRSTAGEGIAWRQLTDGLGPLLRRVSWAYRLGEAEAADPVGDRIQTCAAAISDRSAVGFRRSTEAE
jgi:hypothetical protein